MQGRGAVVGRVARRAESIHDDHPALLTAVLATGLAVWVYFSLVVHLRTTTSADPDTALFIWSMGHAPWRILNGHNPFMTSVIFATSGGANLAYNATAPGLGVVMYPVTALLGPIAAVNVLMILTPVLNTLAARRMLRLIAQRNGVPVSVAAALIGFSPLVLMHNGGRFQIAFQAVMLLLLAELWSLGVEWLRGENLAITRAVRIGALVGVQLWIGSELLAITVGIAVIALITAVVVDRTARTGIAVRPTRRDLVAVGAGIVGVGVVAAPFLSALLFGGERYTQSYHAAARHLFGLRLANAVTPTEATLLNDHLPLAVGRSRLSVFPHEDTGYISIAGVAALAIVAASWRRRTALQRGAVMVSLICWLLALGPTIRWAGTGTGPFGPWRVVERLPVVKEIVANRLSFGIFIALGVLIAGSARRPTAPDRAAGILLVACWCIPALLIPARFTGTTRVSAVAEDALRSGCGGGLVITMPQALEHDAMAWQARSDFGFDLYRGFAFRNSSNAKGDVIELDQIAVSGSSTDASAAAAVTQLRALKIMCVVSPSAAADTVANLSPVLGPPTIAGDVALWAVP